jgi:uridine kinase
MSANRIIAISGPPGSGKSTLARGLVTALGAALIEYDDYQRVTEQDPAEIARIMQSQSGYDQLNMPGLVDALTSLQAGNDIVCAVSGERIVAKPNIIFETPLGRCHTPTGRLIDTLIWIDIPLDVALARNLQCYLDNFLQSDAHSLEQNIRWTRDYLQGYLDYVHAMLLKQQAVVATAADIIIEGHQDTDTQVQAVMQRLNSDANN